MPQSSSVLLAGCGKMGSALVQGWRKAGVMPRLLILDRHLDQSADAYRVIRTVQDIPADFCPDLVVLAIKPAAATDFIAELAGTLGDRYARTALLSVMAGGRCAELAAASNTGKTVPVIRTIPNTPSAVGAGVTGLYASSDATERQKSLAERLLRAVGQVVSVAEEDDLAAVTAISGSGPAYLFLLAELLEKAGQDLGLDAETARKLSHGMIYGSGKMLKDLPHEEAATLRKNVTSPNGTTAAALNVLMAEDAWPRSVSEATKAAARRVRELGG